MAPNKDMIEAFVDGRLSADDHELMVHHISSCTECAAAVIAALAEAARALTTEVNERSAPAWVVTDLTNGDATPAPAADLHQLDLILDSASAHTSSLLLRPEHVREVELDSLPEFHLPPREPTVIRVEGDASTLGSVPLLVPPGEATLEPQSVAELEVQLEPHAEVAAVEAQLIVESGAVSGDQVRPDAEVIPFAEAVPEIEAVTGVDSASEREAVAEVETASEAEVTPEVGTAPEVEMVAEVETTPQVEAAAEVETAPVVEAVAEVGTASEVEAAAVETAPEVEAVAEVATPPAVEVVSEAEAVVTEHEAALEQADTEVIASVTAARVADSAAHGAAVLAAEVSELEDGEEQERAEPVVADEPPAVMTEVAVPFATASEVPSRPAIAPAKPVEDRIPDSERAAIAAAVRRTAEDTAAPRSRWAGVVAAVAALLIFTGLAAYGAMQLRSFASMEPSPEPSTHVASAEAAVPSSVLEPVFDAAAFGGVLDFPPPDSVDAPGEDAAGSGTEEPAQAGVAGAVDAAQPAAPATPRPPATRGRTGTADARATQRPTGIVPESAAAARLLRTTTHRVRPDVDYVLREYDAAAPAPIPREGVSEYRWSDAATSRLYVLSGPVAVAELRSYARRLQNGGQR